MCFCHSTRWVRNDPSGGGKINPHEALSEGTRLRAWDGLYQKGADSMVVVGTHFTFVLIVV